MHLPQSERYNKGEKQKSAVALDHTIILRSGAHEILYVFFRGLFSCTTQSIIMLHYKVLNHILPASVVYYTIQRPGAMIKFGNSPWQSHNEVHSVHQYHN